MFWDPRRACLGQDDWLWRNRLSCANPGYSRGHSRARSRLDEALAEGSRAWDILWVTQEQQGLIAAETKEGSSLNQIVTR